MKLGIPTNREASETAENEEIPVDFANEDEAWDFLSKEGFRMIDVYSYLARIPNGGAYERVIYKVWIYGWSFELFTKEWHFGNPFGSSISTSIKLTPETLRHIKYLRKIAAR